MIQILGIFAVKFLALMVILLLLTASHDQIMGHVRASQPSTSNEEPQITNRITGQSEIIVGSLPGDMSLVDAAKRARNGQTVYFRAGLYSKQVASWRQDDLTLRSLDGPVILDSNGTSAEGKAIFVVKGNNVTIDGLTFKNCKVPDANGAGIRLEGGKLTVLNSTFEGNEQGILTGNSRLQELIVKGSKFIRNGTEAGLSHSIYAGRIKRLVVNSSHFEHSLGGHFIKSRALSSFIKYNKVIDQLGIASVKLDFPEGGRVEIIGNIIQHGESSRNQNILAYGFDALNDDKTDKLIVVHNSFINDRKRACTLVLNPRSGQLSFSNNVLSGDSCDVSNLSEENRRGIEILKNQKLVGSASRLTFAISQLRSITPAQPIGKQYKPNFFFNEKLELEEIKFKAIKFGAIQILAP